MLCVFFEGSFRWPGDVGMLWEVQRCQSRRTTAYRGRCLKEPRSRGSLRAAAPLCAPVPRHCPSPPVAKRGDQQAAVVGVFHRSPGFEALSPGRDEEEEEEDSGVSARLVLTSLPEMVYLCAVPNPSQAQGVLALAIKRVTLVGFWFVFFFLVFGFVVFFSLVACSRQYWKHWSISRLERGFCILRCMSGQHPNGGICCVCVLFAVLDKARRCVGWKPAENPAGASQVCFDPSRQLLNFSSF